MDLFLATKGNSKKNINPIVKGDIPVSKITPEEIIYFSSNIPKEKLIVASSDIINKNVKF